MGHPTMVGSYLSFSYLDCCDGVTMRTGEVMAALLNVQRGLGWQHSLLDRYQSVANTIVHLFPLCCSVVMASRP